MRIKEKASQLSKINFRYIKYRKKGLMKFWYVFNPIFGHGTGCLFGTPKITIPICNRVYLSEIY
ncbi:MAG TPA: hypothetical protein DCG68_03560 [Cryomorphaceae bacterium]|nr:hypothetical protein [Cryomorphaceae bacterium]